MTGRAAVAVADAVIALAVAAWVGGHVALGAFAARITFRDLPRPLAAPTMNAIFQSFDKVIVTALALLIAASFVRRWVGGAVRTRGDWLVNIACDLLFFLGLVEVLFLHPRMEALYEAGRSNEAVFSSLHHWSERCGHLEVGLAAAIYGGQAWARARA